MSVTGNTTPTAIGQILNSGDRLALPLKVFSGEIMTAFERNCVMLPRTMVKTISSGKSAQFPITGTAKAGYHVPGYNLLEENNGLVSLAKSNEKVISIDNALVSVVFIDSLEEKMLHYDTRSIFARQMANALAVAADERLLQVGVLGARATTNITNTSGYRSIAGGTVLSLGATVATTASVLRAGIIQAAETLDTHDVPTEGRFVALRPAQWYLLSEDTARGYVEWSQDQFTKGELKMIGNITPVITNNIPSGVVSGATGENNTYAGTFTNTVGLVWHRDAIGTVKLNDLQIKDWEANELMGHAIRASYAMGHGYLRPEALVEISKA